MFPKHDVEALPATPLIPVAECRRHKWVTGGPAEARQHLNHRTGAPLMFWGIWVTRKCEKCGTVKKEWAKLRYLPESRREAWDAFRPET